MQGRIIGRVVVWAGLRGFGDDDDDDDDDGDAVMRDRRIWGKRRGDFQVKTVLWACYFLGVFDCFSSQLEGGKGGYRTERRNGWAFPVSAHSCFFFALVSGSIQFFLV